MTQKSCIFRRIADLLPELADLEHSQAGPRSPRSGRPTTDTSRLPFGIVIDDPDEPADATTVDGIQAWAAQWAQAITGVTFPASYSLAVLHMEIGDDRTTYPDADMVRQEARDIYERLARRTGHGWVRYGWCSCGGSVWRKAEDDGLSDWMVCDGPAEHFYRDAAHYAAAQRGMARAVTQVGRYWVTKGALHAIWPGLDRRTLHSWVQRGHVTASGGCYDLAQVNHRMATMATAGTTATDGQSEPK